MSKGLNQEELAELARLSAIEAPTPLEAGQLKKLQKKQDRAAQESGGLTEDHGRKVFAIQQTTSQVRPYPVRFLDYEHKGFENRLKTLVAENHDEIMERFGTTKDFNKTKLLRALAYLMDQHSDQELIDAIYEVRRNMPAAHQKGDN